MILAKRVAFWMMLVFSVLIALVSYRFVGLGIEGAFANVGASVLEPRAVFVAHVVAAPIALLLGPFQFITRLRARRPVLHRWTGRLYAIAILVGGIAGLLLALDATDRPVAAAGFGLLAVLWLVFTTLAVAHARARRFAAHRRMMIRSFALTFAAVTLRLQAPFLSFDGTPYLEISHILAWSCWVPNLILAELWLRSDGKRAG